MLSHQNSSYHRRRALAAWTRYATLLLMLALFITTHYPAHIIPKPIAGADKIVHTLAYLLLTFSALTSWDLSIGMLRPQHYFTVWLIGTLYGAFDELTQIPVGRNCDGLDWFSDILGIVLGLTLFRLLRPLVYRLFNLKNCDELTDF